MKIKEVIAALEMFAPLPLQEDWDNSGLQVGLTEAEVSGALLCLDVTEEVIDEAIYKECNLIISHHPLLFHGIKCLTNTSEVQRCIIKAIKNDISIVSMHTNIDNAKNGVNYKIAEKLDMKNIHFLSSKNVNGIIGGSGIIGILSRPLSPADFIKTLKDRFNIECIQTNTLLNRNINKVAICGGAGSFLMNEAIKNNSDAFITGEMSYHDFFDHNDDIQLCVLGHYQSEQFTIEIFKEILNTRCKDIKTYITSVNTNPIKYF